MCVRHEVLNSNFKFGEMFALCAPFSTHHITASSIAQAMENRRFVGLRCSVRVQAGTFCSPPLDPVEQKIAELFCTFSAWFHQSAWLALRRVIFSFLGFVVILNVLVSCDVSVSNNQSGVESLGNVLCSGVAKLQHTA